MPRDKNGPLAFSYFAGFHQMPVQIIKTDDTLSPAIPPLSVTIRGVFPNFLQNSRSSLSKTQLHIVWIMLYGILLQFYKPVSLLQRPL